MKPAKTILLSEGRYADFKRDLVNYSGFFEAGRCLYVLSAGGHRSSMFDAVSLSPEIEMIWRGSFLPYWARPFGLVSAAYGGILKVKGKAGLAIVCDNLLVQAVVEFLVVDKERLEMDAQLRALGRKASALRLAEEGSEGVLAAIFVDDDAMGDYPVIFCCDASADFTLMRGYS